MHRHGRELFHFKIRLACSYICQYDSIRTVHAGDLLTYRLEGK
jgi:hypothetical protein